MLKLGFHRIREHYKWLLPLFKIGVFFALFGTIYAGLEAATRMLYEILQTLTTKVQQVRYQRFTIYIILYILILGIPLSILMYMGLSVLLMLSLTLMFIGVFGVIIYGISALFLSQRVLPLQYRLSIGRVLVVCLGILLLLVPVFYLFT